MRIGIAGAGIGGLAAAALLARAGHEVTVCDRFQAPAPVGSGLVIQPVGQAVLAEIGVLAAAEARAARIYHMLGHEADRGRRVLDVRYGPDGGASYGLGIHRAALFGTLLDAAVAAGARLLPGHEVRAADGRQLQTGAGRIGPFDILIDAAGAGSPLSPLRSRPLGYGAIWGTVDWPEDTPLPATRLSQRYRRADRMVGVLPLGRPDPAGPARAALFWSLRADGFEEWRAAGLDRWRKEATALWPEVAPFVARITDPGQMTMARYSHGTLRHPRSGAVLHIGDAAHRASPQLGQGANMALLDAVAVARALAREPELAALNYARARRAHVWIYQAMSAAFTPQYQSDSRILPWVRDRVLFPVSRIPPVPRILTRLVCGTLVPPTGSLR